MGSGNSKEASAPRMAPSMPEVGSKAPPSTATSTATEIARKDEDWNQPLKSKKLPEDFQRIVDDDDKLMDQLYDGT